MMNLYSIEQHILGCWNICDDIKVLKEAGASAEDMTALATIYQYKFQKMWDEYEDMLHQASLEKAIAEQKNKRPRCDKVMSGDGVNTCLPKAGWVD